MTKITRNNDDPSHSPKYAQLPSPDPTGSGGEHFPGNSDGSRGRPAGEAVAKSLEEGYGDKAKPFHDDYFKVLKGHGPAAPLGQLE